MSNPLPKFQSRPLGNVKTFMNRALTRGDNTSLRDVIAHKDGHFRVVFDKSYFALAEGAAEPTKSQWSTFKKHLKRMDAKLFVFKEHGTVSCGEDECYYVDIGFFAE